jgi:acid stress-induced BolA-like protein IbaG/YrbA
MTADQLQSIITAGLACDHCALEGDGRQRLVYATLGNRMQTDEVHALSMKTFSPAEWAAQSA